MEEAVAKLKTSVTTIGTAAAEYETVKKQPRFGCPWFRCWSFVLAIKKRVDPFHPEPDKACPPDHVMDVYGNREGYACASLKLEKMHREYKVVATEAKALCVGDIVLMTTQDEQDPLECPIHWAIYVGNHNFMSKYGSEGVHVSSWHAMCERYIGCRPSSTMWRVDLP
jgi:hypothetical protein